MHALHTNMRHILISLHKCWKNCKDPLHRFTVQWIRLTLNPYTDIFSVQLTSMREPDQPSHELGKNVYVDVVLILFNQHLETMHELLHVHISFSEAVLTMTHFQGHWKVWAKFHFPVMNVSWQSIALLVSNLIFLFIFLFFPERFYLHDQGWRLGVVFFTSFIMGSLQSRCS